MSIYIGTTCFALDGTLKIDCYNSYTIVPLKQQSRKMSPCRTPTLYTC